MALLPAPLTAPGQGCARQEQEEPGGTRAPGKHGQGLCLQTPSIPPGSWSHLAGKKQPRVRCEVKPEDGRDQDNFPPSCLSFPSKKTRQRGSSQGEARWQGKLWRGSAGPDCHHGCVKECSEDRQGLKHRCRHRLCRSPAAGPVWQAGRAAALRLHPRANTPTPQRGLCPAPHAAGTCSACRPRTLLPALQSGTP